MLGVIGNIGPDLVAFDESFVYADPRLVNFPIAAYSIEPKEQCPHCPHLDNAIMVWSRNNPVNFDPVIWRLCIP